MTAAAMCFSMLTIMARAEQSTVPVQQSENISTSDPQTVVSGESPVGNLLGETLSDSAAAQSSDYVICSVRMEGTKAVVEYSAKENCTILVGLYDDGYSKMLASGKAEVSCDSEIATIPIDTKTLPEYFAIKVFIIETDTLRPLAEAYESDYYTREMQVFLSKTTDDFEADRVLQLSDSKKTNFLVYNKNVIVSDNAYDDFTYDEETGTYTFTQYHEEIDNLSEDQLFAFSDGEQDYVFKMVSIDNDDDSRMIVHTKATNLEEAFEFVRIENNFEADQFEMKKGSQSSGVSEPVCVESVSSDLNSDGSAGSVQRVLDKDVEKKVSMKQEFKLDVGDDENSIKGKLALSMNGYCNIYNSSEKRCIDFSYDYDMSGDLTFKMAKEMKFSLGDWSVPVAYGAFKIGFSPSVTFSGSLSLTASFDINSGRLHVRAMPFNNEKTAKAPKIEALKVTAAIDLGVDIDFNPYVALLDKSLLSAELKCKVGLHLTANMASSATYTAEIIKEKHDCKACLSGSLAWTYSMSASVTFANNYSLSCDDFIDVEHKICDFYLRLDDMEFGIGECPHKSYLVSLKVRNTEGELLGNTQLKLNDKITLITDENGIAKQMIPAGYYDVSCYYNKTPYSYGLVVDKPMCRTITLGSEVMTVEQMMVSSDGKYTYEINEDELTCSLTGINVNDANIILPTELDGMQVIKLGNNNSIKCPETVTSIIVPSSVTFIADYAFYGNKSLKKIQLPGTLTCIDYKAFYNCTALENIYIPNSVTWIGSSAFEGCTSLKKIHLPVNEEFTQLLSRTFYNCTSLQSVIVPEYIDYINDSCFAECKKMSYIKLPKQMKAFNGSVFRGSGIVSLNLPSGITEIPGSFCWDCHDLTYVTIPDGVTKVCDSAFYFTNIHDVKLPASMEKVESYGFGIAVTSVTLPNDLEYTDFSFVNYDGWLGGDIEYKKFAVVREEKPEVTDNTHVLVDCGDYFEEELELDNAGKVFSDPDGEITVVYSDYHNDWANISIALVGNDGTWYQYIINTKCGKQINATVKVSDVLANTKVDGVHTPVPNIKNISEWYVKSFNGAKLRGVILESSVEFDEQDLETPVPVERELEADVSASDVEIDDEIVEFFTVDRRYTGLVPDEIYNFYYVKSFDKSPRDMISSANMIYVSQTRSDKEGNAVVSFANDVSGFKTFAVPMHQQDISTAQVTVPSLTYTGKDLYPQPVVTLNGKTLKEGKNYYLSGDFIAVDKGTYTFEICGMGLYTGTTSAKYTVSDSLRGDVNRDGKVNMKDYALLQQWLNNWDKEIDKDASDINGDGKINMKDFALLQQLLNGWDV